MKKVLDTMTQKLIEDKNSMFYWYPLIKDLDIPQPKTEMYKFNKEEFKTLQREEGIPTTLYDNCISFAEKIGFPLFMRTDNNSCKHGWVKTCHVESKESFMELNSSNCWSNDLNLRKESIIFSLLTFLIVFL